MTDANRITDGVDISTEAVERLVDSLCFDRTIPVTPAVETLRALRNTLTAMTADRDKHGEDARFLSNSLDALIKERDAAFQEVDELKASLTACGRASKTLAVLGLQSPPYTRDDEFRQAVDDVLALTKEVNL